MKMHDLRLLEMHGPNVAGTLYVTKGVSGDQAERAVVEALTVVPLCTEVVHTAMVYWHRAEGRKAVQRFWWQFGPHDSSGEPMHTYPNGLKVNCDLCAALDRYDAARRGRTPLPVGPPA